MAIEHKTVEVPASTVRRVAAVVCELCGRRGRGEDYPVGGDYSQGMYEKMEVHVGMEEGDIYPEGGTINQTILDICPDCFRGKLVPWFEAQGGKVRTNEVDL